MDILGYAFLGLLQGLTEFLPVSSSAHLLLFRHWLGFGTPSPLFVAILHLGTLAALLVWFRADLLRLLKAFSPKGRQERRYLGLLALGLAPLVPAVFLLRGKLAVLFSSPRLAGGLLLVTAGALLGAHGFARGSRLPLNPLRAFLIGVAQAFAILPGISRAGITVSAGIALGVSKDEAFRFSFLLGIPTFLGSALFALLEGTGNESAFGLALGTICAFSSGLLGLWLFRTAVFRRKLAPFGIYCLCLGMAGLLLG